MADVSVNISLIGRILAVAHIIIGIILFGTGIADVSMQGTGLGYIGFGIWIGIWMCITGALGIPATKGERTTSRNVFAALFMAFAITSAVFGAVIVTCYSIILTYMYDYYNGMLESIFMVIFGTGEFGIGILAAVYCCLIKPCTCCVVASPPEGQPLLYPSTGFVTVLGPGGHPMLVPGRAAYDSVAVQGSTEDSQGGHSGEIPVRTSNVAGHCMTFREQTNGSRTSDDAPQVEASSPETEGSRHSSVEFPVHDSEEAGAHMTVPEQATDGVSPIEKSKPNYYSDQLKTATSRVGGVMPQSDVASIEDSLQFNSLVLPPWRSLPDNSSKKVPDKPDGSDKTDKM